MKAIILAAGQGTRIRSVHGERPKCLIASNNGKWTILDRQIQSLFQAGVTDIAIVVGYEKHQIVRHIVRHYPTLFDRFAFIDNHAYAETNNIFSLWLARNWPNGDSFVVLNADVAFSPELLPPALSAAGPITMIVDTAWRDETMKVVIQNGVVVKMSKQITPREFSATYIGITVFDRAIARRFFRTLTRLITEGQTQVFFNAGVQRLVDEGVHVGYVETGGRAWAEIDEASDLAYARQYVFPLLDRADLAA